MIKYRYMFSGLYTDTNIPTLCAFRRERILEYKITNSEQLLQLEQSFDESNTKFLIQNFILLETLNIAEGPGNIVEPL